MRAPSVVGNNFRLHPQAAAFSATIRHKDAWGLGVWSTGRGKLLYWEPRAADLAWLVRPDQTVMAVTVSNMVVSAKRVKGVPTRLCKLDDVTYKPDDELLFGLPQCGVEELVGSPTGQSVLAFLNSGQGEVGYELFSVEPRLAQLHAGPVFEYGYVEAAPVFSPSGQWIALATSNHIEPYWWVGNKGAPREWDAPSRGGIVTAGFLFIQDTVRRKTTRHDLQLRIPPGWHPPEGSSDWCARVVRFTDDCHIEVRIPRLGTRKLSLPLARRIQLDCEPD